jgi:hypothetical protein
MGLLGRANGGAEDSRAETRKPAERRAKERKRQRLVDGFITSALMPTPRPCTVVDMSSGGSKIELWTDCSGQLRPGDRVTLYIPVDRQEVDGQVRWRRNNAIGLQFSSPFRPPTRRYE